VLLAIVLLLLLVFAVTVWLVLVRPDSLRLTANVWRVLISVEMERTSSTRTSPTVDVDT
jgi:hypothetical protein